MNSLTNVEIEWQDASVHACVCDRIRLQYLCLCGCAYVHTHACICTCHKQTSICASNTAGLWWHVLVHPPHSLEKFLIHTQSCTCAHTYSIFSNLSILENIPWPKYSSSCFCLLQSSFISSQSLIFPSLSQLPLPCFSGHTFQAELQPARTRSVALLQSPEEFLSTIACLQKHVCLSLCFPSFHTPPPPSHNNNNNNNSPKSYSQQYMRRFGKGPFICAS